MECHEMSGNGGSTIRPNQGGSKFGQGSPLWAVDAVFYHMYPLGLLGAPQRQSNLGATDAPWVGEQPLDRLLPWVDHVAGLGFNAVYLGPLFESSTHGYDTVNYFRVDRRLGDNAGLRRLVAAFHAKGIKVVLDAVLNHVGRDFPAFQDLRQHGWDSMYRPWFANLDFSRSGPAGDNFAYEGWHGHYDLVKLDLSHRPARQHLLDAVATWVREFDIDGLRLDAADCLSFDFMTELSRHGAGLKPEFWLMGEVVAGNYRQWANESSLHSVTNYEAYKGLWSSLNDHNYFEIDWTLKRQFGPATADSGRYRNLALYNFVDNHDVNRVASTLKDPAQLECLYTMLFAMPGIPSVYYGSEWGMTGQRQPSHDYDLRPALDLDQRRQRETAGQSERPGLCGLIHRLITLRQSHSALRHGQYRAVHVAAEQFAFWRDLEGQPAPVNPNLPPGQDQAPVLAVFNAAASSTIVRLDLRHQGFQGRWLMDLLEPKRSFQVQGSQLMVELTGKSARLLKLL